MLCMLSVAPTGLESLCVPHYRLQTKLREGNAFVSVCLSVWLSHVFPCPFQGWAPPILIPYQMVRVGTHLPSDWYVHGVAVADPAAG